MAISKTSKRNWLLSLSIVLGFWVGTTPANGQSLLPYSPTLNSENLEQQGLELADDAIQLVRFQRIDAALSRAKLATQLAPNRYQTWFILGTLYIQEDEPDKGIKSLEKALALAPEEGGIFFTLGRAYFQKGEYEKAIAQIQQGLTRQSDNPSAFFDLGNSYLKLARYSEAIAAYEQTIGIEKSFWPAINNIGLIKYEQGNAQEALSKWQEALTIDSEQAEPQLAIAVALYASAFLIPSACLPWAYKANKRRVLKKLRRHYLSIVVMLV